MMGLAAGVGAHGYKPWVYSIAPFATYRCLEQIRNDVCLHRLPVAHRRATAAATPTASWARRTTRSRIWRCSKCCRTCSSSSLARTITSPPPCAQMAALAGSRRTCVSRSRASRPTRPVLDEHPSRSPGPTRGVPTAGLAVTVIGAGHGVQIALRALAAHGLDRRKRRRLRRRALSRSTSRRDASSLASARRTRAWSLSRSTTRRAAWASRMQRALPALDVVHAARGGLRARPALREPGVPPAAVRAHARGARGRRARREGGA